MRVLLSWLRDYVDVTDEPDVLGEQLPMLGLGVDAVERLPDGDVVLDLEISSNRPDLLSLIGIARELAAWRRRDAVDATHMPVFHQVDGFMVGEGITFADLKGVLASFAREMFGSGTRTRFQPGYFPFTEPSAELAVTFGGRWLELGGCGMFHPRVLEMAGIDPQRYTAFAFGLGVDRPAMVRYGIPDIRLLWENDLRLLEQF